MRDVTETGSGATERPASFASTVPEFLLDGLSGDNGFFEVACPRKSCGGMFIIEIARWEGDNNGAVKVRTRPCPYCFRVSWLPGEKPGAEPEPEQPKRRTRIVRTKKYGR